MKGSKAIDLYYIANQLTEKPCDDVKIGFKQVKIYTFARNILSTVLMPMQFYAYIFCSLLIKDNSQYKLRDKQI